MLNAQPVYIESYQWYGQYVVELTTIDGMVTTWERNIHTMKKNNMFQFHFQIFVVVVFIILVNLITECWKCHTYIKYNPNEFYHWLAEYVECFLVWFFVLQLCFIRTIIVEWQPTRRRMLQIMLKNGQLLPGKFFSDDGEIIKIRVCNLHTK